MDGKNRNFGPVADAANLIYHADGLLITAGAGMSVDSGLPDFRGTEGFWKAYPALAASHIGFSEIASPDNFVTRPNLAWGFYGHRLSLYRNTQPHIGFRLLKSIGARLKRGAFVYTSNVDGHFQRAGFPQDKVVECHGSIHHMQCLGACDRQIWQADDFQPEVDEARCLLTSPVPACPTCGGIARPNILMFMDFNWLDWRTAFQMERFHEWRMATRNPVVIEIGAGKAIPTVREFGESQDAPVIRINPTDAETTGPDDVSLEMCALEAIEAIARRLLDMGFVKKKI